jgi:hypothetical protein
MGIQGLFPFLQKSAEGAFSLVRPEDMRGKRVAVDMTLYLCRLFFAKQTLTTPRMLAEVYLEFDSGLRERGMVPVHVYDGPPCALKSFAHEKRAKDREASASNLESLRQLAVGVKRKAEEAVDSPDQMHAMSDVEMCLLLSSEQREDV